MKKAASITPLVMIWLVVILVHSDLCIIAAPATTRDTTTTTNSSGCGGSVEDCLVTHDLDSEFPTVVSSHFGRMLSQGYYQVTGGTSKRSPAFDVSGDGYRRNAPLLDAKFKNTNCGQYNRNCEH